MFIQYLWGLLNDMSFMTVLTLISIRVPPTTKLIQSALLNLIYLDIFQTDLWLVPLFFPNLGIDSDERTDQTPPQEGDENPQAILDG